MPATDSIAVLIVAAGSGSRMGGVPKQYRDLNGIPVLRHSVETFLKLLSPEAIRVVVSAGHRHYYDAACGDLSLPDPVIGGETRQQSVRNGLAALEAAAPRRVLVHDAARPFVSEALTARLLAALEEHPAVIPALPLNETIREEDGNGWRTLDRSRLRAMQTPQGFDYALLREAHEMWQNGEATDDGQVVEAAGHAVYLIEGESLNRKLTTPEDWQWASSRKRSYFSTRVGQGYDVHRFIDHPEGSEQVVRLGGISIPHARKLDGHSDADAVLHAITDALLGAAGEGDIGRLFPPSDRQWKDADSSIFLEEAARRVRAKNARIAFVDVTIICEAPKIGPHRDAMRERIAGILRMAYADVNVKATTSEKMGFTGREEGLAAMAIATLDWPREQG